MYDSRPQGKAWAHRPLGNPGASAWNVPTIFTYLQVSSPNPPLFLKPSFEMTGAPWVLIIVSRDWSGVNASFLQELGFQMGWRDWLIVTERETNVQAET